MAENKRSRTKTKPSLILANEFFIISHSTRFTSCFCATQTHTFNSSNSSIFAYICRSLGKYFGFGTIDQTGCFVCATWKTKRERENAGNRQRQHTNFQNEKIASTNWQRSKTRSAKKSKKNTKRKNFVRWPEKCGARKTCYTIASMYRHQAIEAGTSQNKTANEGSGDEQKINAEKRKHKNRLNKVTRAAEMVAEPEAMSFYFCQFCACPNSTDISKHDATTNGSVETKLYNFHVMFRHFELMRLCRSRTNRFGRCANETARPRRI